VEDFEMTELIVEATKGEKKIYKPALLKVAGVSQYREQDLRFEGVEGFWTFSDMAGRDTGGAIPPVGAIGWFKLSGGNPKRGPNAKPGSVYLDVDGFTKATEEEKAGYVSPVQQDTGRFNGPQPGSGAAPQSTEPLPQAYDRMGNSMRDSMGNPTVYYWMFTDEQRRLGMTFNNLTAAIASSSYEDFGLTRVDTDQWQKWFHEASRGLPLTPVQDEPTSGAVEDAAEMEQQAQQHLADQEPRVITEPDGTKVDEESHPW